MGAWSCENVYPVAALCQKNYAMKWNEFHSLQMREQTTLYKLVCLFTQTLVKILKIWTFCKRCSE